jgi:hypothetical protein
MWSDVAPFLIETRAVTERAMTTLPSTTKRKTVATAAKAAG